MILKKLNFLEIRTDALNAIKQGSSSLSFIFIYYGMPISFAAALHIIGYEINTSLFGHLISAISLFAALLFSIIFVVSNNLNTRISEEKSNDEEKKRYLENYSDYANKLVALISYTIIKALMIVVLLILTDAYLDYLSNNSNFLVQILSASTIVLLSQFLMYVVIILKEIYSMQYDDINRKI